MPLKLAGSVRSPCFGMGMMTLLVHSRGAVRASNARFMMLSSWAASDSEFEEFCWDFVIARCFVPELLECRIEFFGGD